jgi:putative SOS response-associated peptidase YedK
MCSRYSLTSPPEAIRRLFGLEKLDPFPPRYNIAPTQPVLLVRETERQQREGVLARWGLMPSWVKDPSAFTTLINARSETVAEKPSFRAAFRHRRCLVPADGFYEWTGAAGAKQPHLIQLKSRAPFAFAGLWENWLGADGSEIETAAILTTLANGDMAAIHDRMPVILFPDQFERWLDCRPGAGAHVADLMKPLSDGLIDAIAVNRKLNNSRLEGADLQLPIAAQPPLF